MEKARYSWSKMPEKYNASYYNDKDYNEGKIFIVIDNVTKRRYMYPRTEIREDDDGTVYEQRIIEKGLFNEDFIGWAISTSEDFINYVENSWLTPKVLNYVVSNYEFPQIFSSTNLCDAMTKDLWEKAFQRNKLVFQYIPIEYVTSDMTESLVETKQPLMNNVPQENLVPESYENLTPESFEEMYFNSDTNHKLKLIKPMRFPKYPRFYSEYSDLLLYTTGVYSLITQKIADDILSISISTIWNIPKKFISKEIAIKAMEHHILFLPYVPAKYQFAKYQKNIIDYDPKYISLIDSSVLTDEIICYAINKSGLVLNCIPYEKRTLEICLKAVEKDPGAIKYVPFELLNQEFIDLINKSRVNIPMENQSYVDECLKAHERFKEKQHQLNFENMINTSEAINPVCFEMPLKLFPGLLTAYALKTLSEHDIYTVGDLLNVSDNSDFYDVILNNPKSYYVEIRGAIRLLKCKYLGIDPLINITDKDCKDFYKQIGLSERTKILTRLISSSNDFYMLCRDPFAEFKLKGLVGRGSIVTIQEIMFKAKIVNDFYDKKKSKVETVTEDETIDALNEELEQVRAEIKGLNSRIDEILAKIQQKMLEKNKGGFLK